MAVSTFFRGLRRVLICALPLLPAISGAAMPGTNDIRRDATVNAIEQVLPCVVNIATESVVEYHDFYDALLRQFYGAQPRTRVDLGSGVIIDEEGYVLTNFHVVRRATRIQVKLWDGREFEADPIVATDASDVALIKIRIKPGQKFKAIRFAADDDLLLGETVIALGNPFGLGGSVTRGILSSKNRRPSTGNEPLDVQDWLQTDAAINPGNSGGPLVNLRGELIGLNVAVYREEQGERGVGVGFSIPIKHVSAALSRFFTPEVSSALWLGAQFKAGAGALVVSMVQPGSPADRAGLKVGHQLLEVDGQPVQTLMACNRLLTKEKDRRRVQLSVSWRRERHVVKVELLGFKEMMREKLGMELGPLDRQKFRAAVNLGDALVIEDVEEAGPAARARLQKGYLVSAIEAQEASNTRAVMGLMSSVPPGETVRVSVIVPRRLGGNYVEFQRASVDLKAR